MIPSNQGLLVRELKIEEQPSKTYKMDLEGNSIRGYADGLEALKQSIYKILNTERYQYIIYSWNYGIELMDLFGEPVTYVCSEVERRIREALLCDTRILSVTDFLFDTSVRKCVHVTFTVHSIFGDMKTEREVNI